MRETNEQIVLEEIDRKPDFLLVLFSTPFCGKCEIAERYLKEVILQLPEFPVYKVLVDYSPIIVEKYQVTSAPSFKLFVNGEVAQTLFGIRTTDDLYYTLKNYLQKKNYYDDFDWGELFGEKEKEDNIEEE